MTRLPAYILIDADGRLVAGADTADEGFDMLYDQGVGAYVIPAGRVRVNIDKQSPKTSALYKLYEEVERMQKPLGLAMGHRTYTDGEVHAWAARIEAADPGIFLHNKMQAITEARSEFYWGLGIAQYFIDQAVAKGYLPLV